MAGLGVYTNGFGSRGIKRGVEDVYAGSEPRRFAPGFVPRKMCSFFLENRCTKGSTCTFAHSPDELHPEASQPETTLDDQASFEEAMGVREGLAEDEMDEQDRFDDDLSQLARGPVPSQAPKLWGDDLAVDESQMAEAEAEAEAEADFQATFEAAEEGSLTSAALGPRQFPVKPRHFCCFWLRHPIHCQKGDSCPNAHGFDELGMDGRSAVIRCGSGPVATVTREEPSRGGADWMGAKGFKGGMDWLGWDAMGGADRYGPPGSAKGKGKGACGSKGGAMMALPAPSMGGPTSLAPSTRFDGAPFKPTKICQFWFQEPSACARGDNCTFAHGVHELRPSSAENCGVSRFHHNPVKPTKMCTFFALNKCQKGLSCTFAHDESELRGS